MKVNIYGVGRSGTKAIQLWIGYLLAKEYETVWINYEPFLYQSRKLDFSARGWKIHRNTPLFINDSVILDDYFAKFISRLSAHEVVVTKFIRANGRINAINELMQPDFSFLVIRDLYQVLESILLCDWSFFKDQYEWKRLCQQARQLYPFLESQGYLDSKYTNKLIKTAVYWFVMNMYALDNLHNTIVLNFNDLKPLDIFPVNSKIEAEPISDRKFQGKNIHTDYPLNEVLSEKKLIGIVNNKMLMDKNKFRKIRHYGIRLNQVLGNRFSPYSSGSLCKIKCEQEKSKLNNDSEEHYLSNKIKIVVPRNDFLDQLNLRVKSLLDTVLSRQKQ